MPRYEQSGSTGDAARPVALGAAGVGQHPGQRRCRHTGRPDRRVGRRSAAWCRRRPAPRLPSSRRPGPIVSVAISTPVRCSSRGRRAAPACRRRWPGSPCPRRTGCTRTSRVEAAVVALERAAAPARAIWPAISTPVGPPPTTTNVSQRGARPGSSSQLGHLEGAEDARAQFHRVVERLHARRHRRTRRGRSTTGRRRRRRSGCRTGSSQRLADRVAGSAPRVARDRTRSTSPSSHPRRCGWRRRTSRIGGAISPSESIPVATW